MNVTPLSSWPGRAERDLAAALHAVIVAAVRDAITELAPALTSPPPGQLLSPKQAADELGISLTKLHELLSAGKIPRRKLGSKTTRIARADLDAYVAGLDAQGAGR